MSTKLTAQQIIDETVEYYKNNPRSVKVREDGSRVCQYLNDETSAMCAFGRCLTENSLKVAHEQYEGLPAYSVLGDTEIKLKPQYEGQPNAFWQELQYLHDTPRFWDGNTLSDEGVRRVKELKKLFV